MTEHEHDWPDDFDALLDVGSQSTDGMDAAKAALRAVVSGQREGTGLRNAAAHSETARQGAEGFAVLAGQLAEIENLLVLVDRSLRVSQPPVPGKIGIRWWRTRSHDDLRWPVLVTWHPIGRQWRARPLAQVRRDRINRKGSAELCADETYDLARSAALLIREYTTIRKRMQASLRHLIACRSSASSTVGQLRAVILYSHEQTVLKLLNEGYEVDARTASLPETYLP